MTSILMPLSTVHISILKATRALPTSQIMPPFTTILLTVCESQCTISMPSTVYPLTLIGAIPNDICMHSPAMTQTALEIPSVDIPLLNRTVPVPLTIQLPTVEEVALEVSDSLRPVVS